MFDTYKSAEVVETVDKRQYHIGLAPKDIAPFVLLCGDTERVDKVARYFDEASAPISSREYTTITGKYKGISMSVMATGIGADNTEIAIVELSQIIERPTLIRVGSSASVRNGVKNGDLVISSGAVRMENTSTQFVVDGYPALAHHEVVLALLESASRQKRVFHLGLTATASGFYGAEGRSTSVFKTRRPDLVKDLENMNVVNMEMEASALFTMSALADFRSGAVCAIYAERCNNKFIDADTKKAAEQDCIHVALGAVEVLAGMDKLRGNNKYWLPHMGT